MIPGASSQTAVVALNGVFNRMGITQEKIYLYAQQIVKD